MIVAALILLAVGSADVARQFLRPTHRRVGYALLAVALIALGALAGAWPAALLAVAIAGAWVWLFPFGAPARAGLWPLAAVAIICAVFIAVLGARVDAGLIGQVWALPSPVGDLAVDQTLLALGALCFLLESGNVVVRAALVAEMPPSAASAIEATAAAEAGDDSPAQPSAPIGPVVRPILKGGRLIGPLERVVVFALTLAGMYTLLAAVLAAKGIVRFPEISRDGDLGNRAEYFLVGSLVSWVTALAAAFLVWWAFATP
jgi:hypothetical protein